LIKNPVLWNLENQMTGDSIHLISDMETDKMDSLKVIENAFIISEDTVGHRGYNQAKGKDLFGKFIENELKLVDLVKNTEVIYYMYDDDGSLIGIDKTKCSKIRLRLEKSDIEDITFITDPDGAITPEKDFPPDSRKLEGFIWRGDERIRSPEDIFDADDNNLVLPVIQGISEPIDTESTEEEGPEDATSPPTPKTSRPAGTPKSNGA
jgi:hypothetical protein